MKCPTRLDASQPRTTLFVVKAKPIHCVLVLFWAFQVIPSAGKRHLPEWFDFPLIQWSSIGVSAFLCGIGALLSLNLLMGQHRGEGYLCLIGFVFPAIDLLVTSGFMYVSLSNAVVLMQPQRKEFVTISKLIEGARDSTVLPDKRIKVASYLYQNWGVTTMILSPDGQLAAFDPTEEDKLARNKEVALMDEVKKQLVSINWVLKQTHWVLLSFLCISTTTFFIGLGIQTFRRSPVVARADYPR